MTRILTKVLAAAAVLAIAAPLGAGEEGEGGEPDLDIVKRVDGQMVPPGKVKVDNYEVVELAVGRTTQKVPGWAVKDVYYADRHPYYTTAVEKFEKGNYVTAAKGFRLALESMRTAKWADEYCSFGIGNSLYEAGYWEGYTDKQNFKYSSPSQYFRQCIKANPKSRFLLEASVKLAISLAEEGKLSESEAAFNQNESTLKTYRDSMGRVASEYRDFADKYIAMNVMGFARMLEKREDLKKEEKERDYGKGLAKYSEAQSKSLGKFPNVYSEAVDGEMRCLIKNKEYKAAEDRASRIIEKFKETADPDMIGMLPGSYTVKGLSNYNEAVKAAERGMAPQAQKLFAEARWDFLHVVVQFFDNDEYVAKAHYFAGLCYDKLREGEPGGSGLERAIRHFEAIVRNYPRSAFKTLAEDELNRLRPQLPAGTPVAAPVERPAEAAPADE